MGNYNNDYYQSYKGTSSNNTAANCCSGAGILSLTNGVVSDSLREIINAMNNSNNYAFNRNTGSYYSKTQKGKQRKVRFSAIDLIHDNYDDDNSDHHDINDMF